MPQPKLQTGEENFKGLFISLIIFLTVLPFFHRLEMAEEMMTAAIAVVILYTVVSFGFRREGKSLLWMGIGVVLTALVAYITPYKYDDYASLALYMAFLSYSVYLIFKFILSTSKVTSNIILGAICIYLLIGIIWAMGYVLLNTLAPGSFNIPDSAALSLMHQLFKHFIYYSMATLTTLGYGDIVPLTTPARYYSVLEALSGQLYVGILVARLVGMHVTQK